MVLTFSCHLPHQLLFVLFQVLHIQISRGLNPVLVHLDGKRPDQAQAGRRVGEDAYHQRLPLDLLVQPLQEIRRLQIFVMLPWQAVERQRFLDVRLHPVA